MILVLAFFSFLLSVQSKENYYTKGAKEGVPQHSALGFLNASGDFEVGRNDIKIKTVSKGGIAEKGGLQIGDEIIGANGKMFEKATAIVDDGGKGPREGLGQAIDQSLLMKNKALSLTINRSNKKIKLTLDLSKILPLANNYPFNCERSAKTLNSLCEKILSFQRPDGAFGGKTVQTATAALGLLSSGEQKYFSAIKKAAYQIVEKDLKKERFPMWAFIYGGTFLCEYYLATGDQGVLGKIKYISDTLALEATSPKGKHGHGIRPKGGYGGKGLNIVSSHVFLVWGLAKKCGVMVHEKQYQATLAILKKCTKKTGGTGYMQAAGMSDASARTGLFTLGLYINEEDIELQKIQGKYLEKHTRRMRECHTNALFGMIWGSAALHCVNPQGYRKHMDYWRWYMHLGEAPKEHDLVRYYIPGKKNNGGDGYLNFTKYNHYAMAMFLGLAQKKLFVHGNKKKFWMKSLLKI